MSGFTNFLEIYGQKKCLFGSKTVFLGQEVHYYMVYIAYFTELILQICDYAQKRRIWREKCKYALDDNLHCHFCSRRKAAKFCHPEYGIILLFHCFILSPRLNWKFYFLSLISPFWFLQLFYADSGNVLKICSRISCFLRKKAIDPVVECLDPILEYVLFALFQ